MTNRAHRPPATLPARRGMRASWFRGPAPHELEVPVEHGAEAPAEAVAPGPTAAPVLPPVRSAFRHPAS